MIEKLKMVAGIAVFLFILVPIVFRVSPLEYILSWILLITLVFGLIFFVNILSWFSDLFKDKNKNKKISRADISSPQSISPEKKIEVINYETVNNAQKNKIDFSLFFARAFALAFLLLILLALFDDYL